MLGDIGCGPFVLEWVVVKPVPTSRFRGAIVGRAYERVPVVEYHRHKESFAFRTRAALKAFATDLLDYDRARLESLPPGVIAEDWVESVREAWP